jgi:hypothetical protein
MEHKDSREYQSEQERRYFETCRKQAEDVRFRSFCRDVAIIADVLHVPVPSKMPLSSPTSVMMTADFTGAMLSLRLDQESKKITFCIDKLPKDVLQSMAFLFYEPISW